MSNVSLPQPAAASPDSSPPAAEAAQKTAAAQAAPAPAATSEPRKKPKPLGVEVGIRQVVADGKLVPMPDRDQIKVPWMDQ